MANTLTECASTYIMSTKFDGLVPSTAQDPPSDNAQFGSAFSVLPRKPSVDILPITVVVFQRGTDVAMTGQPLHEARWGAVVEQVADARVPAPLRGSEFKLLGCVEFPSGEREI